MITLEHRVRPVGNRLDSDFAVDRAPLPGVAAGRQFRASISVRSPRLEVTRSPGASQRIGRRAFFVFRVGAVGFSDKRRTAAGRVGRSPITVPAFDSRIPRDASNAATSTALAGAIPRSPAAPHAAQYFAAHAARSLRLLYRMKSDVELSLIQRCDAVGRADRFEFAGGGDHLAKSSLSCDKSARLIGFVQSDRTLPAASTKNLDHPHRSGDA